MRIQNRVTEGDRYRHDILKVINPFGNAPPDLPELGELKEKEKNLSCHRGIKSWEKTLPTLGVVDMALGQIMLLAGITAVICVCFPKTTVLPGIDIIAKDPALSASFSLVLLSNWINCTVTGRRMLAYKERQKARADKEIRDN